MKGCSWVNSVPKRYVQVPVNGALFGNRDFADVINTDVKIKPSRIQGGPFLDSMADAFLRERRGRFERKRKPWEEAETRGMRPQAKEALEPPEAGRARKEPLPHLRGSTALQTP